MTMSSQDGEEDSVNISNEEELLLPSLLYQVIYNHNRFLF